MGEITEEHSIVAIDRHQQQHQVQLLDNEQRETVVRAYWWR